MMWKKGDSLAHSPIGINMILTLDISTESLLVTGRKVEFVQADTVKLVGQVVGVYKSPLLILEALSLLPQPQHNTYLL